MWIMVVIAVIVLIVGFIKNGTQRSYGHCIDDVYKFRQDVQSPYISPKQLDKNIRNGKYRK